jgi:hypothetical protein
MAPPGIFGGGMGTSTLAFDNGKCFSVQAHRTVMLEYFNFSPWFLGDD